VQPLDARHLLAVDLLAGGHPDGEVAAEVGVDRTTLWRWRTSDPAFRAELARRREELWRSSTDRLRALIPRALGVVEQAIDDGDRGAALALLKLGGVGAVNLARVSPTDADVIAESEAEHAARREHERREAEVRAAEQATELKMREMFAAASEATNAAGDEAGRLCSESPLAKGWGGRRRWTTRSYVGSCDGRQFART
jgi:hypothetical protein